MQAERENAKKGAEARWAKEREKQEPAEQMPRHMPTHVPTQCNPQSKSESESNSETKPNAKAVPKRLRTALEAELMERTEKLVGSVDMKAHGGLWRTLMRKDPNAYTRVLEEIESMAKEQDIPGRQFIKSPGAAFIDLYKRWKS